jgi:hypothetical protein
VGRLVDKWPEDEVFDILRHRRRVSHARHCCFPWLDEVVVAARCRFARQAAALMTSYGKIVSAAVETGVDWLIHIFGNESAEVKEKWREKGGLVMPTSGVARD